MDNEKDLPSNWIKTKSKSRPNTFYYFNIKTKESKWEFPSPPKIPSVGSSKTMESIRSAEDRVINAFKNGSPKKNQADHRLKRLQANLKTEQNHKEKSKMSPKRSAVPLKNVKRKIPDNNNSIIETSKKVKAEIVPIPPKVVPKPKFRTVAQPRAQPAKVNLIKKETDKKIDLKRKSLPADLPKPQYSTPPTNNKNDLIVKNSFSANERLSNFRKNLDDKRIEKILTYEDVEMEDYQNNQTGSDEEMEWESITDEKILEEVTGIRLMGKEQNDGNVINVGDYMLDFRDDHFYIVVDTNIFLSNLGFLENLVGKNFKNVGYPILIVPYVVIQELDEIKSRSAKSLSSLAMKSIRFLNTNFQNQSQFVKGQTSIESNKYLIEIQNSDDKILNCCIQLSQNTERVLLLSNDVNLRNKSIIHQVQAYSKIDIEKISSDAGVPGKEIQLKFL